MFLALLLIIFLFSPADILASAPNIFGLHLTQTSDIISAAPLINSSGGDWGWTTIVIRADQLDTNTWQNFFNQCRRLHITPILRLATTMDQNHWTIPDTNTIDNLADFLNSLNWPVKKQHVILFNEINHDSEWGGGVDIKNFVNISLYTAKKLKSLNPNFYILSSGLDLAAPDSPPNHLSSAATYRQILELQPDYFNYIDALASHSYPNHGYIGKPTDTGPTSIIGYQWELNYLQSLGVNKTLPVFITETGWPHRQGQNPDNSYYTLTTATDFLAKALQIWSQDPRVQTVTPFIYNYPHPPFDHFSWLDSDQQLYPQYQQIIDLPKPANRPHQTTKFTPAKFKIPFILFPNHEYIGQITLTNTGQSIWGKQETSFCLTPQTTANIKLSTLCSPNTIVEPNQSLTLNFIFSIHPTDRHSGKSYISWQDLPPFEITPITDNSTIYRPKTGLWAKITNLFHRLLPL